MTYNGSDKHKISLFENKQDKLTAGDNITLTPLPDGTVQIDSTGGGSGNVSDVQIDGTSILDSDGVANVTTMQGATSQAAGAKGLVPAPSVANKDKFLKGDGTWATPENTTYNDFTGATSQEDGSHGLVPAPQIADKDKYLKGDGTWGEVSVGGNVDDVVMNGQSIVTNKVASFNNYVELTQAQYDALPASKLTDGILYCIKDTGIVEGEQFAPVIYSLEEREIGTWTDGKPLYEKTYEISSNVSFGGINYPNNLEIPSTYDVKYHDGFIQRTTGARDGFIKGYQTAFNTGTDRDISQLVIRSGVVQFYVCSSLQNNFDRVIITIQYTKTTDVPGSGSWGTDGVPMHHYDGNEKIVGTWFGETLYEKSYKVENATPSLKTVVDSSITCYQSAKQIVKIDGIYCAGGFQSNINRPFQNFNTDTSVVSSTFGELLLKLRVESDGLVIRSNTASYGFSYIITIQYTKSP